MIETWDWPGLPNSCDMAGPVSNMEPFGNAVIVTLVDGRKQKVVLHPKRGLVVPRRWRKPR